MDIPFLLIEIWDSEIEMSVKEVFINYLIVYKVMTYDIFSSIAPAMPKPTKGTEFCKLILSKVSKGMQEHLV